jgi:hypothetical protein
MTAKVEYDGMHLDPAMDTYKTIDRIIASATAIAKDAEAAADCRDDVLTEIDHVLAWAQRRLDDEIVRARLMGRA